MGDHPRVCGKNTPLVFGASTGLGSPPRVREKLSLARERGGGSRITPACAGKTPCLQPTFEMFRDHPRVCGKNFTLILCPVCFLGSPPRVREKQLPEYTEPIGTGITPACAGKTTSLAQEGTIGRDHPRVCGKNSTFKCAVITIFGSPPRVREKHIFSSVDLEFIRITPACAGKTYLSTLAVFTIPDHPRVCGKNKRLAFMSSGFMGSPPRVREKHGLE